MLTYADVCMLTLQHHLLMLKVVGVGRTVRGALSEVGVGRVCGGGQEGVWRGSAERWLWP